MNKLEPTFYFENSIEVIRNVDTDVTETINVIINSHDVLSKPLLTRNRVTGDPAEVVKEEYRMYDADSIIGTRSMVYTIPEEDRTDLAITEAEYTPLYIKWCKNINTNQIYLSLIAELKV